MQGKKKSHINERTIIMDSKPVLNDHPKDDQKIGLQDR